MPFPPVPELLPNPPVRIFFSGLMVLEPSPDGRTCEVFVNRSAPSHYLTIEVRRKQAGKPDLIMMRHVGQLAFVRATEPNGSLKHGLFIQVDSGPKGVKRYNGDPSPEGESLDLALNLEGPDLHNGDIGPVDRMGGRPSILLNDGIFYTAAKTRDDLTITLKKNGRPIKVMDPFASLIGTNIYLDDGDKVLVEWRQQGRIETVKLEKPKPDERDLSYEIYIVNDPLYESDAIDAPRHKEFKEYYN